MNTFSADTEPSMESQLIDVSTVPLMALRTLDNEALRDSLRHVVERTAFQWRTETSSSPGHLD